jgi:predicted outer membrane protein
MVTAPRRLDWRRCSAIMVTGIAGALFGGALCAPNAAWANPTTGQAAADVPAAVRASAPPATAVPNPINELPSAPSPGGPIGPADRDLVVKVRLAGLWEQPASEMAIRKGNSPRIREIGTMISGQHAKLDDLTVKAAAKLGIPLPNEPNADQRGWLAEMERATGAEFDRVYVDRLRAAHGKVFPAIANVRAGTRNDIVRELAAQSNAFVLTHLTLLESTGLVAYEALPLPPGPAPAAAAAAAVGNGSLFGGSSTGATVGGVDPTIIWIVLAAALVAGAYSMVRLIRSR